MYLIMSTKKIKAHLKGNMAFEMDLNGHTHHDASPEVGGEDLGRVQRHYY